MSTEVALFQTASGKQVIVQNPASRTRVEQLFENEQDVPTIINSLPRFYSWNARITVIIDPDLNLICSK